MFSEHTTERNHMKTTRALSLVGAFAIAAIALSGCASAGPTNAGEGTKPADAKTQTQEEACDYISTELAKYTDANSNHKSLAAAQKEGIAAMSDIRDSIENVEVKDAFAGVVTISEESIPMMEAMFADPTAEVDQEFADRASAVYESFDEVCPGVATKAE